MNDRSIAFEKISNARDMGGLHTAQGCIISSGFLIRSANLSDATEADKNILREKYHLVPVCPETAGGLPIPREPSERLGSGVIGKSGRDVTAEFGKGAETALALARRFGCKTALLKERSPSCGSGTIYDGSFTGTVIPGDGVAAEKLRAAGVTLYGESELEKLI